MTFARRSFALAVCASLALGACGGGSTASSPQAAGATPSPAAAATDAAATDAAVATTPAETADSGDGTDVEGAAAALNDLSSYKFSMKMTSEGGASFILMQPGGSMSIDGTVVLKPEQAMAMTMTMGDASGASSEMGYRIIGDQAYVSFGPDSWMSSSADDAQKTIDSFKPDKLMGSFGSMSDMTKVGDEDRNGVATTHYTGQLPATIGSTFGLPDAAWTVDSWIARDGGYLVSTALVGTSSGGKFTMSVDASDFDAPGNKVEAPAGAVALPS